VPTAQAGNREVIASTYQAVQRVSAEQAVPALELQGGSPIAAVGTARMPVGSPPAGNGPALDGGEAAPPADNIVLPQPRPLASTAPVPFGGGGAMPPQHPPSAAVPREFEKMALPPYIVEPPDILLIQASDRITLRLQRIEGQHLVAPDGTINLGIYGKIRVVGMTLDQVADAVASRLLELMPGLLRTVKKRDDKGKETNEFEDKGWRGDFSSIELLKKEMQVDVLAYNSKFYYVITDGGGYGQQVYPIPITGNETVLDALAKVNGLPAVANKRRVWVARATRAGQPPKILPVDWMSVTQCGSSATNYQVFPGDRVYVDSDKWIKRDTWLAKRFSPIQRILGVTLLGASTVNAITLGAQSGSGLGGFGAFR
jgi:polysaccharide export outer membrane protein